MRTGDVEIYMSARKHLIVIKMIVIFITVIKLIVNKMIVFKGAI